MTFALWLAAAACFAVALVGRLTSVVVNEPPWLVCGFLLGALAMAAERWPR